MSLLAELMSVDVLNLIGLLAVVFIGLPHGAMDGALAIHLGWMNRPFKAATFLLAYVGLAALVVGMWLVVQQWDSWCSWPSVCFISAG